VTSSLLKLPRKKERKKEENLLRMDVPYLNTPESFSQRNRVRDDGER
jgi:hypothetical protein